MLCQIIDTAKKYNMIKAGDEVIAALSGGADSVCLLLALHELKDRLGITLSALHVNHCLRGDESDRDEQFCRELCNRLNIPFICGRFNVKQEAEKLKLSTELAARDIRYRFFAENSQGKKIATAHNANDNAETVIFNLTRGTGTRGIAGIPPVRDNIIRPLIGVTRNQIENYLSEKGQNYVTDSTNLTDDYTRNIIRHNVIPVLEQINSSLFRTIASDSDNFRTDNSFIESETDKAYEICCNNRSSLKNLRSLHPAVRRRCISRLLSENNIEVNSRRILDIDAICENSGKINLTGNIYAVSFNDILSIKEITPPSLNSEPVCIPLRYGKNTFRGKTVTVVPKECCTNKGVYTVDAEKLSGQAVIRSRMPGDRIKLSGNSFTSSVKKLFNSRIPADERDDICFIADDEGPVFIERIGISDRVHITDNTKKILEISIDCE